MVNPRPLLAAYGVLLTLTIVAAGQDVSSARPGPPPGVEAAALRPARSGATAERRSPPAPDDAPAKSRRGPVPLPTAAHFGLLGTAAVPSLPAAGLLLTPAEERDIREVLAVSGISIGHRFPRNAASLVFPDDELVIPNKVTDLYARKPRATLRVLLRVVADA